MCAVDSSLALWNHLHHPGHLGSHHIPAHCAGRHCWQELKGMLSINSLPFNSPQCVSAAALLGHITTWQDLAEAGN